MYVKWLLKVTNLISEKAWAVCPWQPDWEDKKSSFFFLFFFSSLEHPAQDE